MQKVSSRSTRSIASLAAAAGLAVFASASMSAQASTTEPEKSSIEIIEWNDGDTHAHIESHNGEVVAIVDGKPIRAKRYEMKRGDEGDVLILYDADDNVVHKMAAKSGPAKTIVKAFRVAPGEARGERGPRWVSEMAMSKLGMAKADAERRVVIEMEATQPKARLGVLLFSDAPMVIVEEVLEGSAAKRAGLQRYDVIVEVDGEKTSSFDELTSVLSAFEPGDEIEVVVQRGRKEIEIEIKLDGIEISESGRSSRFFSTAPTPPTPPGFPSAPGGVMSLPGQGNNFVFRFGDEDAAKMGKIGRELRETTMKAISEALDAVDIDLPRSAVESIEEALKSMEESLRSANGSGLFGLGQQSFRFSTDDNDEEQESIWWAPRGLNRLGEMNGLPNTAREDLERLTRKLSESVGRVESKVSSEMDERMAQLESQLGRFERQLEILIERLEEGRDERRAAEREERRERRN